MVASILISSGTAFQPLALAAGQYYPPPALTTPSTINCSTFTNYSRNTGRYSARNIIRNAAVRKEYGENGWSNINSGSSVEGIKYWNPDLEIQVPFEQRPVNEYSSLRDDALYSWGELSTGMFLLRLGGLWSVAFLVLGLPISAASFHPSRETLKFILAAGTGPLLLVSLVLLRIYLGWSYVGDRLLSAVIPYEESGWYDGQMWVKPPEVLARDRLLGSYKVKPVINLVKQTLVAIGALLVTNVAIFIFADPIENNIQSIFATNARDSSVTTTTKKTGIRKKDLLSLPAEVKEDDVLAAAAAAAEAADGRPSYCRNRLYQALAGGQYCKWEDLLGQ